MSSSVALLRGEDHPDFSEDEIAFTAASANTSPTGCATRYYAGRQPAQNQTVHPG
jgi:hypothetical protein